MIGIYEIVHVTSGRTYIGSSENVDRRLKAHRAMLCRGSHDNIHLQRAWTKYGANAFALRLRERCRLSRLRTREAAVIRQIPVHLLYNLSPVIRRGARASNASLDDRKARTIYRLAAKGQSVPQLALQFNLPIWTVRRIVAGVTFLRVTKGKPARHQLPARGSRIVHSKLSVGDIDEIRRRLTAGSLGAHIAKDFSVTPAAIYAIRDGRTWKHHPMSS